MNWQPISKVPRNQDVFIAFKNVLKKWRIVKAVYFEKHTLQAGDDYEFCEYSEEEDQYYCPEGWYENVHAETGLDYSFHFLDDIKPTHWMPLPDPPKERGAK